MKSDILLASGMNRVDQTEIIISRLTSQMWGMKDLGAGSSLSERTAKSILEVQNMIMVQ